MPGGAGTPGGYDGGSGSSSGGGGNQGGGGPGGDGGAAQRAAAQRAQAQLDADRLNASRAAAAAAKEAEASASAREKAIQTAALTTKPKEPIFSPHKDTPTQIAEQKEIDLYGYQDAKAQAPTTFRPKTAPITIHGKDGSYTKEQPVKYSPTYYQDRSKIGGETWGERAEAGIKRGMGLGTLAAGVLLPALLPAKAASAYKMYKTAKTVSAFANKFGITNKDIVQTLTGNLRSNINKDILKQTQKDAIPKVADRHPGTGKKKRTTPTDDRGDGINQIQEIKNLESTVSEGAQTFLSDEQKEQYQLVQNKMKAALADGSYIDKDGKHIDLSDEQVNALTQWITKINDMLVDPLPVGAAEGGRIDRPLM